MGRWDRERRDAAFDKGVRDWSKTKGQGASNPVTELFHPSYSPPRGQKRAYDSGRRYAERRQRRRRR